MTEVDPNAAVEYVSGDRLDVVVRHQGVHLRVSVWGQEESRPECSVAVISPSTLTVSVPPRNLTQDSALRRNVRGRRITAADAFSIVLQLTEVLGDSDTFVTLAKVDLVEGVLQRWGLLQRPEGS